MIRIAAVDDEPHVLDRLERMLEGITDVRLCGRYADAESMLNGLEREPVDAVFLDINLPGMNGLELGDRILERWPDMSVVIVTAWDDYAVEAFAMDAADYLVKPMTSERLQKTLQRLRIRHPDVTPVSSGPKISLRCFSRLSFEVDGRPLAFQHAKGRELLAFLAAQKGRPVGWDLISDALWQDSPADKAHANFHAASYQLRKLLAVHGIGRLYVSERGNYRLDLSDVRFDLTRFEEAAREIQVAGTPPERRVQAFRTMNELYGEGFLAAEGFDWSYGEEIRCQELLKSRAVLMSRQTSPP
jgi:two-component SAPR family response regulator